MAEKCCSTSRDGFVYPYPYIHNYLYPHPLARLFSAALKKPHLFLFSLSKSANSGLHRTEFYRVIFFILYPAFLAFLPLRVQPNLVCSLSSRNARDGLPL